MPSNTPNPGDHFQVLLYKFCKTVEALVPNPLVANPGDHLQVLMYKLVVNFQAYVA